MSGKVGITAVTSFSESIGTSGSNGNALLIVEASEDT